MTTRIQVVTEPILQLDIVKIIFYVDFVKMCVCVCVCGGGVERKKSQKIYNSKNP